MAHNFVTGALAGAVVAGLGAGTVSVLMGPVLSPTPVVTETVVTGAGTPPPAAEPDALPQAGLGDGASPQAASPGIPAPLSGSEPSAVVDTRSAGRPETGAAGGLGPVPSEAASEPGQSLVTRADPPRQPGAPAVQPARPEADELSISNNPVQPPAPTVDEATPQLGALAPEAEEVPVVPQAEAPIAASDDPAHTEVATEAERQVDAGTSTAAPDPAETPQVAEAPESTGSLPETPAAEAEAPRIAEAPQQPDGGQEPPSVVDVPEPPATPVAEVSESRSPEQPETSAREMAELPETTAPEVVTSDPVQPQPPALADEVATAPAIETSDPAQPEIPARETAEAPDPAAPAVASGDPAQPEPPAVETAEAPETAGPAVETMDPVQPEAPVETAEASDGASPSVETGDPAQPEMPAVEIAVAPVAEEPAQPEAPTTAGTPEIDLPEADAPTEAIAETPQADAPQPAPEETDLAALPETQAPARPPVSSLIDRDGTGTGRPRIGTPAASLIDRADGVTTNRLPSLAEEPAPEAEQAPARPVERFAVTTETTGDKPLMSIVLIDDGTTPMGLEALEAFPYPITFAVDTAWEGATEAMRTYRDAGFEVMALADLPQGAQPQDAEVSLASALAAVPEAVAVLEGDAGGLQASREISDQVAGILAESGHGLVLYPQGLNTAQAIAARAGVPAAVLFRDFDSKGQTATVIRRFLDQAAFKAGQEGAVIMLGRLRPETISALLIWGLADRASRVAFVPVSRVLLPAGADS